MPALPQGHTVYKTSLQLTKATAVTEDSGSFVTVALNKAEQDKVIF